MSSYKNWSQMWRTTENLQRKMHLAMSTFEVSRYFFLWDYVWPSKVGGKWVFSIYPPPSTSFGGVCSSTGLSLKIPKSLDLHVNCLLKGYLISYISFYLRCSKKCGATCSRIICPEKCGLKLECGHKCVGICGELCICTGICCIHKNIIFFYVIESYHPH